MASELKGNNLKKALKSQNFTVALRGDRIRIQRDGKTRFYKKSSFQEGGPRLLGALENNGFDLERAEKDLSNGFKKETELERIKKDFPVAANVKVERPAFKVGWKAVTPSQADAWLEKNAKNRNIRPSRVAQLVRSIRSGNFIQTGDPIRFDEKGNLLDGQHRLVAIKEAGVAVTLLVIEGVPEASRVVIDTGAARTFGDYLKMEGVKNFATVAGTVRLAVRYERRREWESKGEVLNIATFKPTHIELRERWRKDKEAFGEAAHEAHSLHGALRGRVSVYGLVYYTLAKIDADDTNYFFDRLIDGQGLVEGDSILHLRRLLEKEAMGRSSFSTGDAGADMLIALFFKAWNAFRENRALDNLRWRQGGRSPEAFPKPK